MAIIKAVNSKNSIRGIVNYVSNDKKTTEKLMLGLNCSNNPNLVIEEMNFTKKLYNKKSGRQYKHFVQSFNPKDKINPSKAIQIGRELAEKIFKGYEVFIVTHTDKKHVHNHFIVNSVNFKNGRKFQQSKNDLKEMKKINDEICEREGLSITKSEKDVLTSFNSKKYKAIEKSLQGKYKSYIIDLWHSVNMTLKKSTSKEEFIKLMEQKKYKVNWIDTRKNITFITPEGKKIIFFLVSIQSEEERKEKQSEEELKNISQQLENISKIKEMDYQSSLVMKSLEKYNEKYEKLKQEQKELLELANQKIENLEESNKILKEAISQELKDLTKIIKQQLSELNLRTIHQITRLSDNSQKVIKELEEKINSTYTSNTSRITEKTADTIQRCKELQESSEKRFKSYYNRKHIIDWLIYIYIIISPVILILMYIKIRK